MIRTPLLAVLTFCSTLTTAQQALKTEFSDPFPKPAAYSSRIIQCTNGNTFLFNYKKSGGDILLFGKDRKLISKSLFTGRMMTGNEANNSSVNLAFESGNQLAFFVEQKFGGKQTIFRTLVSTTDAAISGEEQLMELSRPKSGSAWAALGGVDAGFKTVHDPATGGYAVIAWDGFTEVEDDFLRVNMYSADHQKLWSYFYKKQDPSQKYLEFMDGIVKGSNLYLCTHEFTTRSKGTEQSNIVMTEIGPGGQHVRQQKLAMEPELKGFSGELRYMPSAGRMMLVTRRNDEKEKLQFTSIRERDFGVDWSKPVGLDMLEEALKTQCGKKGKFKGRLSGWYEDGQGYSMVFMEPKDITYSGTSGSGRISGPSSTSYFTEDIGVLQLDAALEPKSGLIVKRFEVSDHPTRVSLRSQPDRHDVAMGGTGELAFEKWQNKQFSSTDFIHTGKGDYLIFNTNPDNYKHEACKGTRHFGSVFEATTALFSLKNGQLERSQLWGENAAEDRGKAAVIWSSDYAPATGTYAVMMTESTGGREKRMITRLAWVQIPN